MYVLLFGLWIVAKSIRQIYVLLAKLYYTGKPGCRHYEPNTFNCKQILVAIRCRNESAARRLVWLLAQLLGVVDVGYQ